MIAREDVVNAFRLFLGREPESDEIVSRYSAEIPDLQALRTLFLNCAEFRDRLPGASQSRPPVLPMTVPLMPVAVTATPEELAALLAKVQSQWQHLGETEPHWSVLTCDSYFQRHFHMHRDAFYASGKSEVDQFKRSLTRAGIGQAPGNACLELGCGVGRVTGELAGLYEQVIAVDISTAHLRVAQDYLQGRKVNNVRWHHLDGPAAIETLPPFDALYSRIVLQHNPPPVMAWLLDRLLAQLGPGGIAYFQIPTYRMGYRFDVAEYLATANRTQMELHFLPQPELFRILTRRHCQLLEIREDDAIGLAAAALSNTVLVRKANGSPRMQ